MAANGWRYSQIHRREARTTRRQGGFLEPIQAVQGSNLSLSSLRSVDHRSLQTRSPHLSATRSGVLLTALAKLGSFGLPSPTKMTAEHYSSTPL